MTASHSAGSCHFWLGLLPIFPGLGNRGQTHRVSSHSHSTGRARAPQASVATKLQHHCPPSDPLSVGLGQYVQRDNWNRPGSPSLSAWEKENMGLSLSSSIPPHFPQGLPGYMDRDGLTRDLLSDGTYLLPTVCVCVCAIMCNKSLLSSEGDLASENSFYCARGSMTSVWF